MQHLIMNNQSVMKILGSRKTHALSILNLTVLLSDNKQLIIEFRFGKNNNIAISNINICYCCTNKEVLIAFCSEKERKRQKR